MALESQNDEETYGEIFDKSISGQLDLDAIMVSASVASWYKKLDPNVLSKLWKIDINDAKRTLEVTSQQNLRKDNPKLACNYGTNDRMLRYKRIDDYFFMDTLFATKKSKKSSRGQTCYQLFVTDRGFVFVVPMKKESEVLQA